MKLLALSILCAVLPVLAQDQTQPSPEQKLLLRQPGQELLFQVVLPQGIARETYGPTVTFTATAITFTQDPAMTHLTGNVVLKAASFAVRADEVDLRR